MGVPLFSSIKARLLLVGGVPVLVTGVIAALGLFGMGRIAGEASVLADRALPSSLLAMQASRAASDALRHTRGAMLTTDDAERTRLLGEARDASHRLGEAAGGFGALGLAPQDAAAASSLEGAAARYTAQLGEVWTLLAQNSVIGTEQATDLAREKLPPLVAEMDHAAGELESLTADERRRATQSLQGALSSARALLTWGPAAGLALAAGVGLLTARALAASLRRLGDRLGAIADRRESLEHRVVDAAEGGEIGAVARSFNRVADDVRGIVTRFSTMASDVHVACGQIAAAAEETNATVSLQSERVREIQKALDDLARHLEDTTGSAAEARAAVTSAGEAAGNGEKAVARTIDGVRLLRDAVSAGATSVGRLGQRSEQVGAIIGVIDDIADQTNLLALNAAIEAARAGQHGRGFAVVADEVRKLAERTTQATRQVSDTIRMIQEETAAAVGQMTGGTGRADESLALAEQASGTLAEIVASVRRTIAAIDTITRGSEAQRELGESIRREAGTIVSGTDEVARGSAQAAQAVTGLLGKADALQRTIDDFTSPARA